MTKPPALHPSRERHLDRLFVVTAQAAVLLAFFGAPMHLAFAQGDGSDAELNASLSRCVSSERPRSARYVLHKVKDEHVHYEGPYLMSDPEADALLPLLQRRAREQDGTDAKASFAEVDNPDDCSFLYRRKGMKTLSMSQGSEVKVMKSRDEIVRWNEGTPLTPIVCLQPKSTAYRSNAFEAKRAQAYGPDETEACTTAKRCLAEEAGLLSSPVVENECGCVASIAGLQLCTAKPQQAKDTVVGIRG